MDIILHRVQDFLTTDNYADVLDRFINSGFAFFEMDIFWIDGSDVEIGRPDQIVEHVKYGLLNKIVNWAKEKNVVFYLDIKFSSDYNQKLEKVRDFVQCLNPEKFYFLSYEIDKMKLLSLSNGFKHCIICRVPEINEQSYDLFLLPFELAEKCFLDKNLSALTDKIIVGKIETMEQIEWTIERNFDKIMINNYKLIEETDKNGINRIFNSITFLQSSLNRQNGNTSHLLSLNPKSNIERR